MVQIRQRNIIVYFETRTKPIRRIHMYTDEVPSRICKY